jgi:hypothetical protein
MRVPFVIYADFETFNKKIDTCEPNPQQSYTQKIMKQVPSSFCFYLVSTPTGAHAASGSSLARASPANSSVTSGGAHAASGEKFEPVTYAASNDEDVAEIFVEKMICNKYEKYPKLRYSQMKQCINFARGKYATSVNSHSHLKNFSPKRRTGTRSGTIVI